MRKSSAILLVLIIVIIGVVALINNLKANSSIDEETARCIAEKSQLFVSKTCSHCQQQKQILENYLDLFDIIECTEDIEDCRKNNIMSIPTWIIAGKRYIGVKSLKELKRLTGC